MLNPALSRPEPGKWLSAGLAVLMHLLLIVVLFYGVQWQRRPPAPVEVELIGAAPPPPPPAPREEPQPKPEPKVEPPKPEPKVEPPKQPDIAVKEPKPEKKPPKPDPKPEPKPEPKPQPKPEPKKPQAASAPVAKPEPTEQDRLAALMNRASADARMQALMKADSARAAAQAGGSPGAIKTWEGQIQNAIRPNVRKPEGVSGRPKPEFLIQLLPTGEILGEPKLITSSGNPAVDEAVDRAIRKTARLPLPADPKVFQRQLRLIFDPYDPNY